MKELNNQTEVKKEENSDKKKKTSDKKKDRLITGFLVLLIILGLGIFLYPKISDYWNTMVQMRAINTYQEKVSKLEDSEIESLLKQAREYNEKLYGLENPLRNYEKIKNYYEVLDITGTGIMGYVNIPAIDVELPVYHGTNSEVLNVAIGHLQGSSLPVGGENTHTVLSAHRGLPSAKLFSDLDELREGDTFTITILNYTVTYEVDEINIVLPSDVEKLKISEGKDYATLLTCTPYGVNTHRLFVRGHRVENAKGEKNVKVTADAVLIDKNSVIPFIALPLFILLVVYWILESKREKERKQRRRIIDEGKK
ncbi:sortase A [Eubacterium uniforme]|uniref:Sortase A n=1 Tax=Eubacterium uniforme TaxID=39495 RepID=A0A1T4VZA7_9FIRM|nr:class C sortase [Eubacterium uniforme]SKA69801.1 sortase A [Eubacterium uniforme]